MIFVEENQIPPVILEGEEPANLWRTDANEYREE